MSRGGGVKGWGEWESGVECIGSRDGVVGVVVHQRGRQGVVGTRAGEVKGVVGIKGVVRVKGCGWWMSKGWVMGGSMVKEWGGGGQGSGRVGVVGSRW